LRAHARVRTCVMLFYIFSFFILTLWVTGAESRGGGARIYPTAGIFLGTSCAGSYLGADCAAVYLNAGGPGTYLDVGCAGIYPGAGCAIVYSVCSANV